MSRTVEFYGHDLDQELHQDQMDLTMSALSDASGHMKDMDYKQCAIMLRIAAREIVKLDRFKNVRPTGD